MNIDIKKGTIKFDVLSYHCPCGKEFKGTEFNKKSLARSFTSRRNKCKVWQCLKLISKIPKYKNRPLKDVLKELF